MLTSTPTVLLLFFTNTETCHGLHTCLRLTSLSMDFFFFDNCQLLIISFKKNVI